MKTTFDILLRSTDNVCIDSMSVKINRRTIERGTAAIDKLESYVKEYVENNFPSFLPSITNV